MVTGCRGRGNIYEILNSIRCHLVNFLLQYFTHLIQAENLTVDLRILREPSYQVTKKCAYCIGVFYGEKQIANLPPRYKGSKKRIMYIYIIKTQLLCVFVCPDCIKEMEE